MINKLSAPATLNLDQLSERSTINISHAKPGDQSKLRELANEFEALFLNIVVKKMRESIPKANFIDGGNAEEIYRSLLDFEYSKQIAQQRNSGIAQAIEAQLSGMMDLNKSK